MYVYGSESINEGFCVLSTQFCFEFYCLLKTMSITLKKKRISEDKYFEEKERKEEKGCY